MKTTLLAAVAAAAAAMTLSSSASFADTVTTSLRKPHGPLQTTKKLRPVRKHVHVHRHVYRPVYRPGPVQRSAANLAAVRRQVRSDGRVTLIEKFKLGAAERRHANVVRSYR